MLAYLDLSSSLLKGLKFTQVSGMDLTELSGSQIRNFKIAFSKFVETLDYWEQNIKIFYIAVENKESITDITNQVWNRQNWNGPNKGARICTEVS